MAKKFTSKEAYVQRIQQLANVGGTKKTLNESKTIGTLIDYKRASDNTAYGVIKENKKYFIKKAGINENLDAADFTYIGGLENITSYQYTNINEAIKNRDLLIQSMNEGFQSRFDKSGKLIKESKQEESAIEDIEKASDKVDDLDKATEKAKEEPEMDTPDMDTEPVSDDLPPMPEPQDDLGDDDAEPTPTPDSDDMPDMPAPEAEGDDDLAIDDIDLDGEESEEDDSDEPKDKPISMDADDMSDPSKEVESKLGKITNQIRKMDLTPSQVKSYVNTFLSAFKNEFPDVEIEDRKEMANKILKVVDDSEIEDLENDESIEENQKCSECGEFTSYVESLGYDKDSIKECGDDEMASIVSGYANAHAEGLNEGDFESVALFTNENINNSLVNEYGHDDFVENMNEYFKKIQESEFDTLQKIDELNWGGLKNVGKAMLGDVGKKAKEVKANVSKGVSDTWGAARKGMEDAGAAIATKIGGIYDNVSKSIDDLSTKYSQVYNKAEFNTHLGELEKISEKLGDALGKLNQASVKAGNGELNIGSIMSTISNKIRRHGKADLADKRLAEVNINEIDDNDELEVVDFPDTGVDTTPDMENAISTSTGFNTQPTPESSVSVDVDGQNKTINIAMNEQKLQKYIKMRVQELKGLKKQTINENKKSDGLKKLDEMISKELKAQESEQKLRKYVINRLEEKTGKRKAKLNESEKSPALKKLDALIDKQYKLMENVEGEEMLDENMFRNFVDSFRSKANVAKDRLEKIDTNEPDQVEKLFKYIFGDIMDKQGVVKNGAKLVGFDTKLQIIRDFISNGGGGVVAKLQNKKPVGITYMKPQEYKDFINKSFKFSSTGGSGGQNV